MRKESKSLVSMANKSLETVNLKESVNLGQRLCIKVSTVVLKIKKMKGRAKVRYINEGSVLFDVLNEDVMSASELTQQVAS